MDLGIKKTFVLPSSKVKKDFFDFPILDLGSQKTGFRSKNNAFFLHFHVPGPQKKLRGQTKIFFLIFDFQARLSKKGFSERKNDFLKHSPVQMLPGAVLRVKKTFLVSKIWARAVVSGGAKRRRRCIAKRCGRWV